MELKEKYKKTEIGLIPIDWGNVTIFQMTSNIIDYRGRTPKKLGMNWGGGDIVALSAGNVRQGYIDFGTDSYFGSEKLYKRWMTNGSPKKNDIVFTMEAPLGNVALIPDNKKYILSQRTILLQVNENYNSIYIFYFLMSSFFQKYLNEKATGSTAQGIKRSIFEKLLVVFPPSQKEQTAIAKALSNADAWIQSLTRLIAKKRQIKQGAMQVLLSPKENWIEKRLGNVATLKARIGWQGLTTSEYLPNGHYYLVTGTEFKDGFIDWNNCHFVEEIRYQQDKNIQLKQNDVLVTKDGTIGKVAFINSFDKPATLNSGVFVIRPLKEAFDPLFFYYILCSKCFSIFLNQLTAGSTINHLYQKDFVNFNFKVPRKIEEQRQIGSILLDLDEDIRRVEEKLTKAKKIKQGMMQNLLTGRIRLI